MWETKVIFNGSDGNNTTTIDTSTDEVWARSKYTRELDKWFTILCPKWFEILCPMTITDYNKVGINDYTCTHEQYIHNQNQFKLDLIYMCLAGKNKNSNTKCSFSIEVYEK